MEQIRITAPNLQEAMAKVKSQLGDNATILSWNNLGDAIEVIAASTKPEEPPQPLAEFQTKGGSAPRYDIFAKEEELKKRENLERQRALRAYGTTQDTQADKQPQKKGLNPIDLTTKGLGALIGKKAKPPVAANPVNTNPANQNNDHNTNNASDEKSETTAKATEKQSQQKISAPKLNALVPLLVKAGLHLKEIKPFAKHLDKPENIDNPPLKTLVEILDAEYFFEPLEAAPDHAIALLGPAGCGKTITAAKLAARALSMGTEVLLISTDTERQGGVEQLKGLAKKLGASFNFADNSHEAGQLVRSGLDAGRVVIIDCAAASPVEPASMRVMETLLDETNAEPILCLPADTRTDDLEDMVEAFKQIGVDRNIITRLDLTTRRAGILVGLKKHKMKISQISATPFIAGGIVLGSAQRLANLILEPFDGTE